MEIKKAIADLRVGKMIVIVDDERRENEGDLMMAAEFVTPEKMAFIIRHTGGVVCAPISREIADKLKLTPMVKDNQDKFTTPFTVSVDSVKTNTGISAADRCLTARMLASANAGPTDLTRPGHLFPLVAKAGGVLERAGHTEAAVDLCRLANLRPAAVISELMARDGTMMRAAALKKFAKRHKLTLISISDLINYSSATFTLGPMLLVK